VWVFAAAGWLALGAVAVVVMRRRGHDTFAWAILFVFLGPLALPLAVSAERHPPPDPQHPVHGGEVDLLVAHDGSSHASAALDAALALLGRRVTSLTLAVVVDIEAPSTVRGRDALRDAQTRLDTLARDLADATPAPIDTVVLHGEPARTLERFAAEHEYELIVAGSRGHRAAHLARGSVARTLAGQTTIPVLIGPTVR